MRTHPSLRLPESTAFSLAFAVMGLAFLYYAHHPINHDTGWFMYAARGMLSGGTLYKDYVDVNAPLAYLTLIPAAALSNLPFFSNEGALAINILAYVLAAYVLCVMVTRHMNLEPAARTALLGALLVIMCFLPRYAFGQREHIFAVLIIPYALAAGMRLENRKLPRNLAIACGVAAGLAVSIKLPYAIVPAVIETAALVRRQSWKIAFTPDMLALAASTAAFYAICVALYPAYWSDIVPTAVALYGPYDNAEFLADALILQVPLFAAGFAVGEYRGRGALVGARWMLAAATLGAFALFILQRKGWPHHALPILILASALFVFNLADIEKQIAAERFTAWLRMGVTACALVFAFYLAAIGGVVDEDMMANVEARVRQTDGSFYIMSTGNYPAFPLALNRAYRWTSRFPQLIMLPGLIEADMNGKPSPYEGAFRAAVLEDLKNGKPASVFLYSGVDAGGIDGSTMLDWLRHDPDFEQEWSSHYRWVGNTGSFAIFERL